MLIKSMILLVLLLQIICKVRQPIPQVVPPKPSSIKNTLNDILQTPQNSTPTVKRQNIPQAERILDINKDPKNQNNVGKPDVPKKDDYDVLMKQWHVEMKDFVPDDIISFQVEAKEMDVMVETVTKANLIRGAYFTHDSRETITFVIRTPSNKTIFTKAGKHESIFSVNTTEVGEHEFIFDNRLGKTKKGITFALDIQNAKKDQIQAKDIDPLEEDIQEIASSLSGIYYEHKFSQMRYDAGHNSMRTTNERIMVFTMLETGAILAVTIWQIWYIKRLFDTRRLV